MPADDFTRYRMFFQSHDLSGAPQLPTPASKRSYELRTPVNAIIAFGEVLETEHFGSLTRQQRAYVRAILQTGHHLLTVMDRTPTGCSCLTLVPNSF
jgi:hypothetical protein